jgi:hypothetical protein
MKERPRLSDMSRRSRKPLLHLEQGDLAPLALNTPPAPAKPSSMTRNLDIEYALDDTRALSLPNPATPEEEHALVERFLSGLEKLFSRENNWTFLQPLLLTVEHCARCQTCSDSCHIFEASGGAEIYRPTYRSEILRRLYFQYKDR